MSEKLKSFINNMGKDPEVLERYKQDPEAVMEEHGLSDAHKALVRNGDKEKIKKEAGVEDAHVNFLIL